MGHSPSLGLQLERASTDPPLEDGSDLPAATAVDGVGGRTPRNRKFCVICKTRKGPQKSGPKVRDRLLSPQCPEMMRKGSS